MVSDQDKLAILETAINSEGTFTELDPISGIGEVLCKDGLFEKLKYPYGARYRVTESGKRFSAERLPPAEW